MNKDEAKYILRCYRPSSQDASDPLMAEALELARRDPDLATWLAEEQALDAKLADCFGKVPVPPGLKSQLLAARKVVPLRSWKKPALWLAAAASIALLAALAITILRQPAISPVTAEPQSELIDLARQSPHVSYMARNYAQIEEWMRAQGISFEMTLPVRLSQQRFEGCRVFLWQGRQVALLCLEVDGSHVDLLAFRDDSKSPDEVRPVARAGELQTVTWKRSGVTYILAGNVSAGTLESLL